MDSKRHVENPDSGPWLSPKLTVTGRLEGTCAGRPVELSAEGRRLSLRVPNLRSAWTLRRNISAAVVGLLLRLRNHNLQLRIAVGGRWDFEILPHPGFAIRLLVPSLKTATE